MVQAFLASSIGESVSGIREMLTNDPKNLSVIFITTASKGQQGDLSWLEADVAGFVNMGFNVTRYDIDGKTEAQMREDFKDAQVICVGGGNTYFLLDRVRASSFDKVIMELLEKGVIYVGSSAGSVLAGPTIETARGADDDTVVLDLKDFTGLGLIDVAIIPHYDEEKYADVFKKRISSWKEPHKILFLNNDQALVVRGETLKVVSCGTDRT